MRHNVYRGGMVVGLVALILVIVVEVFAAPAARSAPATRSDEPPPIGWAQAPALVSTASFTIALAAVIPGGLTLRSASPMPVIAAGVCLCWSKRVTSASSRMGRC